MKNNPTVIIMKSALSSYLALSGWFFLLSFYAIVKFLITDNYNFLKWAAIGLIPAFFLVLWAASFKIVLSEEELTYRSLFQWTRSIRFDDIYKASQSYVVDTQLVGQNRILIWTNQNHSRPYIAINMKVFKATDIKRLLAVLKPYDHQN